MSCVWINFFSLIASGNGVVDQRSSPGYKTGGIGNVVEKVLESIAKSGQSLMVDVVPPGERV